MQQLDLFSGYMKPLCTRGWSSRCERAMRDKCTCECEGANHNRTSIALNVAGIKKHKLLTFNLKNMAKETCQFPGCTEDCSIEDNSFKIEYVPSLKGSGVGLAIVCEAHHVEFLAGTLEERKQFIIKLDEQRTRNLSRV